jgi:hypothetical protein
MFQGYLSLATALLSIKIRAGFVPVARVHHRDMRNT